MKGFVYAATGHIGYTELAIQSARTLKAQCPDYPIDLFTDKPVDCDVFDRVHVYEESWFRAKIDALRDSRFEKTIFIDADTIIIDDLSDAFNVLDRFDIAAVHDQGRNSKQSQLLHEITLPEAFPQLNTGMIAVKKTPEIKEFLLNWKTKLQASAANYDQPLFRELLWHAPLKLYVLPAEYNVMHLDWLRVINHKRGYPKLIHSPKLHEYISGSREKVTCLYDLLGFRTLRNIINTHKFKHTQSMLKIPDEYLFGPNSQRSIPDRIKISMLKKLLNSPFSD